MKEGNPACGVCKHSSGCDPELEPITRHKVKVTKPNPDLCRHHSCVNGITAAVEAAGKYIKTHDEIDKPIHFGTWDKPLGTRRFEADGRIQSLQNGEWYYTGQQINAENIVRMATMQRHRPG